MNIVCGTGHRPDKLGGYSNESHNKLVDIAECWLEINKPDKVISGMAVGWDLALAQAATNLKIPLIAAIPCRNQDEKWSDTDKLHRKMLLLLAQEKHFISEEYTKSCMLDRNIWMVENSNMVLAMWNGENEGGTAHCIRYAKKMGKPIVNLWKIYQEV